MINLHRNLTSITFLDLGSCEFQKKKFDLLQKGYLPDFWKNKITNIYFFVAAAFLPLNDKPDRGKSKYLPKNPFICVQNIIRKLQHSENVFLETRSMKYISRKRNGNFFLIRHYNFDAFLEKKNIYSVLCGCVN